MTANERIKLQRKIKNINKLIHGLLNTEEDLIRFTEWFVTKKRDIAVEAVLHMPAEEFINTSINQNVLYKDYQDVRSINNFMLIKAEIFDEYFKTLEKVSFIIAPKDFKFKKK